MTLTVDDDRALQALAGHDLSGFAEVILQSGTQMYAVEAQALSSFYAPAAVKAAAGARPRRDLALVARQVLGTALLMVFTAAAVVVAVLRAGGAG